MLRHDIDDLSPIDLSDADAVKQWGNDELKGRKADCKKDLGAVLDCIELSKLLKQEATEHVKRRESWGRSPSSLTAWRYTGASCSSAAGMKQILHYSRALSVVL